MLLKWAIVTLMALAVGAVAVGIVLAAPVPSDRDVVAMNEPVALVTPTTMITPSLPFTRVHPVALAISQFFSIPYTSVTTLHDSGIGFGVIARAYMTAKASDGQLTPDQVLQLHESGVGWGQIMQQYGVHPGGKGLGPIMSGHANGTDPSPSNTPSNPKDSRQPSCPGNSCNAPGHNKGGRHK
jgi:hypothetical protein